MAQVKFWTDRANTLLSSLVALQSRDTSVDDVSQSQEDTVSQKCVELLEVNTGDRHERVAGMIHIARQSHWYEDFVE